MLKRRGEKPQGMHSPAGHEGVMVLVTRMGWRQGAGFQDLALLLPQAGNEIVKQNLLLISPYYLLLFIVLLLWLRS